MFRARRWKHVFVVALLIVGRVSAEMDMDDMASYYGEKAETACATYVAATSKTENILGQVSCRTFRSIVEEFFNMKQGAISLALKRGGHDARNPWLHFENFDAGINKAIENTVRHIADSCGATPEWTEFQGAIKTIADSFQPGWIKWIAGDVFQGDKKFAKALGDGKWDFKLQDENDDYNNRARGMAGTGKATVHIGSTRI